MKKEKIITFKKAQKAVKEFGDLLFGLTRLANQLGINMEESFNLARNKITKKYNPPTPENKIVA